MRFSLQSKISTWALIVFAPVIASAQSPLIDIMQNLIVLLLRLLPIAMTLAVLAFFWGMALLTLNAGNEQKRTTGKSIMFWGILTLFVMVSIWGIVSVLAQLTGATPGGTCPPPSINGQTLSTC